MPDLILLDLNIPKIDGLGVLETLRRNALTQNIAVSIVTASDKERDLAESYHLGADCFLRKDVDSIQFQKTIRQLLPKWRDLVREYAGASGNNKKA